MTVRLLSNPHVSTLQTALRIEGNFGFPKQKACNPTNRPA